MKEATDCVKDPLATVNSFNNLKAELALAEAFGVSQENLEESYQALNNMQDNIDKVSSFKNMTRNGPNNIYFDKSAFII